MSGATWYQPITDSAPRKQRGQILATTTGEAVSKCSQVIELEGKNEAYNQYQSNPLMQGSLNGVEGGTKER